MPGDYLYQASPPKYYRISDNLTMNGPWVANNVRPTSLDSIHHPPLENGSTRFANPRLYTFNDALEDYQPPPPLTGDPGSPASSTWSLPRGAEQATTHGTRPRDTSSLSVPSTPCDAISYFDAIWQYTNGEQDGVVLRECSHGDGTPDNSLGNYRPRSSLGDLKPVRYPSQDPEEERHEFKESFSTPREKGRARSCEGERGWNRRYGRVDVERAQWEMSRLIDFATSTCVEDWECIKTIWDRVNRSDSEAKDACKALRRDIKFGPPTTQLSASRLWAILMQDCPQFFVTHTTNRKFLGVIENIALSPATTSVVRDRLVEVVGTSVYLLKNSKNIKPYQSTWKKLRVQLKLIYSPEGLKAPVDDPFWNFSPPNPVSSSPTEPKHATVKGTSDLREGSTVQHLFEECKAALSNCQILRDIFSNANPASVASDPQIQAFREKCSNFQDIVGLRIDWAMELSDRAGTRQGFLSGSSQIAGTTMEEQLVKVLFNTNEEIVDVFKTYDDLVRISESEYEAADPSQPPPYTLPVLDLGNSFVVGSSDTTSTPSPTSPTTVSDTSATDQHQSTSTPLLEPTISQEAPISRNMSATEVVSHLVAHGCRDLSSELDHASFDDYPTSHGGLSDVYAGQLLNGTRIAVKALRVSTTTIKHDPTHLKVSSNQWVYHR
ncbi:hypothetical protein B0J17DRAFT_253317 [Rhizoctonia solani]|nr:hypothetical protein B0J17DRAFT_253317 [Rhizoctonia solani]